MILYHGSNCVVDKIDLGKCRPFKDFGRGFYNTAEEYLKMFVTRNVIAYIAKDNGVDIKTAMETFYNSEIFDKLQDTETGLYRESASYVYELFRSGVAD
jgi:hypothetical protein